MQFGYLQVIDGQSKESTEIELKEAIKLIQSSNGIAETGFLDTETCESLMKLQHLTNSIKTNNKRRTRRHATFALRWPKTNLTWR